MKLRWGALAIVLVLSALMPRVLTAQGTQNPGRERKAGALKQNYPNPFNPETRIPFRIGDESDYVAYWDGKYMGTRNEVASGVYLYELRIDGSRLVNRMLVTK
jgi:hypothetical protein